MSNRKDILKDIIVCIVLCITIWLVMKDGRLFAEFEITSGDIVDGHYGTLAELARILHNGDIPLWSYYHGGMTAVGDPVMQAFYPVTVILTYVCWNDAGYLDFSIYQYEIIIHMIIFAIGTYLLIRTIKQNYIVAGLISCLSTFSICMYMTRGWLYIWCGLVYCPLIVACEFNTFLRNKNEKYKYIIFSGIAIGLSGLAAPAQGCLMNILIYIIVFLCFCISDHTIDGIIEYFKNSVITGVLSCCIMAVTMLPFADMMTKAYRFVPNEAISSGLGRVSYENFIADKLSFEELKVMYTTNFGWLSLGLLLSILLLLGIIIPKKRDTEWFAGFAIVLFSICYSCGLFFPRIIYYIPFYNNIREPYLYSFFTTVGAAIIAAYGLERVMDFGFSLNKYIGGLVVVIIIIFTGREVWIYNNVVCGNEYSAQEASVIIDKVHDNVRSEYGEYFMNDDSGRVASVQAGAYPTNESVILGYKEVDAYMNPFYLRAYNLKYYLDFSKRIYLQNIKYLVTGTEEGERYLTTLGYKKVKDDITAYKTYTESETNKIKLYEKSELPGFGWLVNKMSYYNEDTPLEELAAQINQSSPEEMVYINSDYCNKDTRQSIDAIGNDDNSVVGDVLLIDYGTNKVTFSTDTENACILSTAEIFDEGWNVYVDGKKADIFEINMAFRGALIPAGKHTIVFKYLPKPFIVGVLLSVMSIIVSAVVMVKKSKKYIHDSRSKK